MITIIANEKRQLQKRRRTSFLFYALLALAGMSESERLAVTAFGMNRIPASTNESSTRFNSSLRMKSKKNSFRNLQKGRTTNGSPSTELVARKAALVVDSGTASSSEGIRERVNSFLRSKKRKSRVVEEVKDIDSIYACLGEGQKEAVYTAVIFHAPYCRACKASMPLFEELARQYNKKNKKYSRQQRKKLTWVSSDAQAPLTSDISVRKRPVVKFVSVPVTGENSKELQDQFSVTRFPLARIYDPVDGLVDEQPLLRKLFPRFRERLESVVVEASASAESPIPSVVAQFKNTTLT
mmetsp:Transcript_26636/g.62563  ORF Transcript_26636/g.62563 Transcript_26636/m.62563 type:complete len:296 (-) Transcript_26636:93-980(-)|eukprot:CAMPEP_0197185234 /NCGR_PEP_ID=MMETSP1423-20130617/11493_1 /TAXON_ID=476441 /ORGANISM="Pseudo-nitzschia heimii, Strain UNC1101" /LENGTH=295 /DNA_ID=CAMNT_0042636243 /DNA_START=39 /DNA_END=926 /DNA_ORIENTATION=+